MDAEDPMRDEKDEDKGIKPARPARNRAAAAVVLSPDAELCVCVCATAAAESLFEVFSVRDGVSAHPTQPISGRGEHGQAGLCASDAPICFACSERTMQALGGALRTD